MHSDRLPRQGNSGRLDLSSGAEIQPKASIMATWHGYFGKTSDYQTSDTMWQEEDNKLKKSYSFKDFREAFAFMNQVADVVNEMDHHPFWTNMYNKVSFELNTHDAGDIVTEKDYQLAAAIDRIYNA
jgi:4a-hydroxytetrahydrobiopterin dehydratase